MKRPVWLFSMDSHQFWAAPTTTGGLKAFYHRYGQKAASTHIELVHFADDSRIDEWKQQWQTQELPKAQAALEAGLLPVAGFSVYTWNAAEFLDLIRFVKQTCPGLLVIAGGPHVQKVEDYLLEDPLDAIIMGEGEFTFTELLDAPDRHHWSTINGLAYVDAHQVKTTPARERIKDLDIIPSALEVVPLCDDAGNPLYDSISYETSRGCPFKCAFCEWGTGAIGGKMYQFSMARVEQDWRAIVAAGIKNIWLADSNFGALKDDLAKAELICELKRTTGLPSTFATSWSKKHSPRVQEIVLKLNDNGLLPHYQLALQTLTPLALKLSNRQNMEANKYQPIAKSMAEAGVPIAAELIWGLPGDNLADFERNLDTLLATFPNINIFGYTLLPGTEFYDKRHEYEIQTIPVAGYGKAKGEYVVGCHTYSREEGLEGYFLIGSHITLVHGHIIPLLTRYLALTGLLPVSPLLRAVLRRLQREFASVLSDIDLDNPMSSYEHRSEIYLAILKEPVRCYAVIEAELHSWMDQNQLSAGQRHHILSVLRLDAVFTPRYGKNHREEHTLHFDADQVLKALEAMEIPPESAFAEGCTHWAIQYPGGVGDVLKDPHGGSWIRGQLQAPDTSVRPEGSVTNDSLAMEIA